MAHRVKCPECNSCMSAIWVVADRYYFCGFCHTYYITEGKILILVQNPYEIAFAKNTIIDPVQTDGDTNEEISTQIESSTEGITKIQNEGEGGGGSAGGKDSSDGAQQEQNSPRPSEPEPSS